LHYQLPQQVTLAVLDFLLTIRSARLILMTVFIEDVSLKAIAQDVDKYKEQGALRALLFV